MEIKTDELKRIMLAVAHSISVDETRAPLLCVNLPKGFSVWESTDGHRATRVTLKPKAFGLVESEKGAGMLEANDFRVCAKALPTGKKTLMATVSHGAKGVTVAFGSQTFLIRYHEGYSFPELTRVIPERPEKGCVRWGINPRYLSEACDAGEIFAGKGEHVTLTPCPYDEGESTKGAAFAPMRVEAFTEFGEMLTVIMPVRI